MFFGLGLHGYYNLDLSKKQRLTTRNNYVSKLQIKKDSRFFYGVIIARKLNFLNSTITLRNVFYNEVMEKTFPVFSIRNTLVGPILKNRLRHFLSPYL
ncbi:50S ribosomal protein L19 [Patescibacteria group bacterium]|nr:50S ribosomal protein L19 [Patescibacteria group bacterium]